MIRYLLGMYGLVALVFLANWQMFQLCAKVRP